MAFDIEDFVRSGYSRFSAGERIPTLEYWHADGKFTSSSDDPDHATYSGIDEVQGQYRRWVEAYPDLQVELLELRVNGDRAFAWVRFSGHGGGSGVPIDMELAHIWTIENGKIRRMQEFFDRAEGLAAAGLEDQAMARANIEIVRDGYDAFNRGDLETCLAAIDPSIEWWPATDELVIEPYRGHDGYRTLFAETREGVPDIKAEIEELHVAGDQVVACLRFWGRGRESRAPVEVREAQVVRLRDGKIIEVHEYRERDEALVAAGLKG